MMTPRERLLTALDHREPDRVPIDLGGNQTGIHKFAYQKLLDHLGFREEIEIMDLVQQLAKPSEAVLERLHVDTRYVFAGGAKTFNAEVVRRERKTSPTTGVVRGSVGSPTTGVVRESTDYPTTPVVGDVRVWSDFTDEFGVTWSMPDDFPYYFDISHHPLAGMSLGEIEEYPFPKGDDPTRFEGLRERALELKRETPYAVISGISGVVYEICWYMRGLESLFMDMLDHPAILEAILDRTLKFWLDWFRLFLDEVGDVVDVIMIGDDLAAQTGPLFPPRIYRSIVKPRHKQLVQYIKTRTSAKIWYHSCGSVIEYIPDLLDNGVDILNPVQISAENMDPSDLKARFGDKLTFWGGGIDAQRILPNASPERIREEVRRNIEAFKPGGGYVFNNVHNIQADVPPESILALFDAAYDFGEY